MVKREKNYGKWLDSVVKLSYKIAHGELFSDFFGERGVSMKKITRRLMSLVLVLAMAVSFSTGFSGSVAAKSTGNPKLEKKSVTLELGKSSTIKVLNADDAKVKFISSNASVAKVSKNGKVTALKAGKAKIRVVVERQKKKKTLTYSVTVKKPSMKKNTTVRVGDQTLLTVNNIPAKAKVTWKSANNNKASVDRNGFVLGKETGKTRITATVKYKRATYTVSTNLSVKKETKASKAQKTVSGDKDNSVDVFTISDVRIDRNKNEVSAIVSAPEKCTLLVKFIDENVFFDASYPNNKTYIDGGKLYAQCEVTAGTDLISIPAKINGTLPRYFVTEAVLLKSDKSQLCTPITDIDNTERYRKFTAVTVDDFDKDKTVVNFDDSRDNNFGVLADDVKVIEASSVTAKYGKSIDDVTYVIKKASEKISKGDKVYVTDGKNSQIFKVKSLAGSTNEYKVTPAKTGDEKNGYGLDQFYEYLKVDMGDDPYSYDDSPSPIKTGLFCVQNSISDTLTPGTISKDTGFEASPTLKIDTTINEEKKYGVSGKITGNLTACAKFEYDPFRLGFKYFRFDFTFSTDLNAKISIAPGKGTSSDINKFKQEKKTSKDFSLLKAAIPTNVPGLSIFAELKVNTKWKTSAGLEINGHVETTHGFRFNTKDGFKPVNKKEVKWDINANGHVEMEFGPRPAIGVQFLGGVLSADVGVAFGVKGEATAKVPLKQSSNNTHGCMLCIDGNLKAFIEANASFKYNVKVVKGSATLKIVGTEWDLFDFYCSLINAKNSTFGGKVHCGRGKCPNKIVKAA